MWRALRRLFSVNGGISGLAYLGIGIGLFIIKYVLDAALVHLWLGQSWLPWDYLKIEWRNIDFRDVHVVRFATVLLALALPFIWCGVILTLKRLRSIHWPGALVLLFFLPYVNVPFLFLIGFWPARPEPEHRDEVKEAEKGSVAVVIGFTIAAVGLVVLATVLLENYGWGLFVGIPFLIGFVPGLLHQTKTSSPIRECLMIGLGLELLVAASLLAFAFEGIICLIMVAPIAILLNAFGAFVGYNIRKAAGWARRQRALCCCGAFLLMPLLLFSEKSLAFEPSLFPVTTTVEIDASAATVWKHVVTFSELPAPTEWIFHAGVAHPLRAEIRGQGVGAVRHCVFSTGPFVEPIEIWDEPRLLRFSVKKNPPPMHELSFREVRPPHLDGYFESEQGQFALTALTPTRTRLAGTTWYRHGLWPETYWKLWSDYIVHTIHLRVLRHIKVEAERESRITSISSAK
jgi:hypothetical protein